MVATICLVPLSSASTGNTFCKCKCDCWMGIHKRLFSHLLVRNKGAPSPPCCFPFTKTKLTAWLMGHRVRSSVSPVLLENMLFADDFSLPSNEHADLQTMLNKLRVYAERKSLTVNTQTLDLWDIHGRHIQSQKSLFRNITLLANRIHARAHVASQDRLCQSMLFLLVCMRVRSGPFLTYNMHGVSCWHARRWGHGPMMLVSPFPFRRWWSDTMVYLSSNRSCKTVNSLISAVLS